MDQTTSVSAARLADLVGDFDRQPAYAGLAGSLKLLIGDGRVPRGTRLPSERDLTSALAVSRTTVTRAYASLRDAGFAEARHGSGTYTRMPGSAAASRDRTLYPHSVPSGAAGDLIDLNCAVASAPSAVADAYAHAVEELPAHLGGHGYFPGGLPVLQSQLARRFTDRGLPTAPEQILVVPGALAGVAVAAAALVRPGHRVLTESPGYPNAMNTLRAFGARLVANRVDAEGWDLEDLGRLVRRTRPQAAYLIPDFHNPTGHVMSDAERATYASHLASADTVAIVDEAHADLALDAAALAAMPSPFAAHSPSAITVGSASKSIWGGLRTGWMRVPEAQVDRFVDARVSLDLGVPVLEQLVLSRLLADEEAVLSEQRARLGRQRDTLVAAVRDRLPSWRFRVPTGGLVLWCELPEALAIPLATEAERLRVVMTPGSTFAVDDGLRGFVRIPWTRPEAELVDAVDRIAEAWAHVQDRTVPDSPGTQRARAI